MADEKTATVGALAPVNLSRVTFGLRYETTWGLADHIGGVIDAILREPGTPFGPDVFGLTSMDQAERTLFSDDTKNSLRINQQDTILKFSVNSRNLATVSELASGFTRFVTQPLRSVGGVRRIVRMGVVFELADSRTILRNPPIAKYIAADFQNATTLQMRFTRRFPSHEALAKKRVEDYRNAIYSVNEKENGEVLIGIDYQEYFVPPLDAGEWDDRPFDRFVDRGLNYFSGEFYQWFRKLTDVAEVA